MTWDVQRKTSPPTLADDLAFQVGMALAAQDV
jgi:hypothetical protein